MMSRSKGFMDKKKRNCILAGAFLLACGLLLLFTGKRPQEQSAGQSEPEGMTRETEVVFKEEDKGGEERQDETSPQDGKSVPTGEEKPQSISQEETEILVTPEGDTVVIKENPMEEKANAGTPDKDQGRPDKGETEMPGTEKPDAREPVDGGSAELPFVPAQ